MWSEMSSRKKEVQSSENLYDTISEVTFSSNLFFISQLYIETFFPSWKWKVFWAHLNKIAEMAQEVKKKRKNPKYIAREDMCGVKCWRSDICRLSLQAWTCYLSLREKVFRLGDKCRQCSSLRAVRFWDV